MDQIDQQAKQLADKAKQLAEKRLAEYAITTPYHRLTDAVCVQFGKESFLACSPDQMAEVVDMPKLSQLVKDYCGEDKVTGCVEEEIEAIVNMHPELLKVSDKLN